MARCFDWRSTRDIQPRGVRPSPPLHQEQEDKEVDFLDWSHRQLCVAVEPRMVFWRTTGEPLFGILSRFSEAFAVRIGSATSRSAHRTVNEQALSE